MTIRESNIWVRLCSTFVFLLQFLRRHPTGKTSRMGRADEFVNKTRRLSHPSGLPSYCHWRRATFLRTARALLRSLRRWMDNRHLTHPGRQLAVSHRLWIFACAKEEIAEFFSLGCSRFRISEIGNMYNRCIELFENLLNNWFRVRYKLYIYSLIYNNTP